MGTTTQLGVRFGAAMSAGRIYWGQIATVLGMMLLGIVLATQWTATQLGYQAALGAPDYVIFGYPFYAPWRFFIWWFQYDHYARPIFERGGAIVLVSATIAVASAFAFSRWRAIEEKRSNTYGAARWADSKDIEKFGLTDGDGVILGQWGGEILRHDGDEHVLVVAPTNTGKSVGVSLPTGLVWPHSYFTLDLKGENWAITSGLRAAYGPVFRFAPASPDTHRYNPLTQIRRGETEIGDAQVLADMLVDPEGSLRERTHWQLRAFELLVTAMLWTLYAEEQKTLARVAYILADPQRPVLQLFGAMLTRPIRDGAPHPAVAAGARQFLDMAEAERSGVISTALGYLALFRDPILARATETSDFAIEDLIIGDKPVSLYVIVPPEEISRLRPVLRLIFNQILKRLTEIAGGMDGKGRRVLLMLDEFTQLGRLDFFENALAYIRGYRIKACLVAQSLNQIAKAYGENNSILDNAHIRVAYACNDERTAKRISDMLGVTTETRSQMNYAGSRMAPWLGHTMVSRQEVPRPLLTPGEVMQLPPDDSLIFAGGSAPIRAKKVRYFKSKLFKERVRPKIIIDPPKGPGLPSAWDALSATQSSAGAAAKNHSGAQTTSAKPTGAPAKMHDDAKPSADAKNAAGASEPQSAPADPSAGVRDAMRQHAFEFSQTPSMAMESPAANAPDEFAEPAIEQQLADDGLDIPMTGPAAAIRQAFFERKSLDLDMGQ